MDVIRKVASPLATYSRHSITWTAGWLWKATCNIWRDMLHTEPD